MYTYDDIVLNLFLLYENMRVRFLAVFCRYLILLVTFGFNFKKIKLECKEPLVPGFESFQNKKNFWTKLF